MNRYTNGLEWANVRVYRSYGIGQLPMMTIAMIMMIIEQQVYIKV